MFDYNIKMQNIHCNHSFDGILYPLGQRVAEFFYGH